MRELITRVGKALNESGIRHEMIVVDDNSQDGIEEAVNQLRAEGNHCRIIVRQDERGLSSAVIRGFNESTGQFLVCMDADLQHPPESVPKLVQALKDGADFTAGTRYGGHKSIDKDWPLHRRVISGGARLLARPLSPLSDPMTGFFGLRRSVWLRGRAQVNPIGFKICLECYIKCGVSSSALREVPIFFGTRLHGESKLDSKVIVSYLIHLQQLYRSKYGILLAILAFIVLLVFYRLLF